ncbi:MAG: ergothioneine biosynthesis glutamate--cysteine ligase EgtA [Actinomycetota bacterium]|nr:ergothioneine biosynthesis glutamate--cysteine ligase EgtA [Actinomycetota bacterium]
MAVPSVTSTRLSQDPPGERDPQRPLDVRRALDHVAGSALRAAAPGVVGLELESHLVDLARPAARVGWSRTNDVLRKLTALPGGSAITLEPGGQVELATPPAQDVAAAVHALRCDAVTVRQALRSEGLGLAWLGLDPVRPPLRVTPGARYAAMERHYRATGQASAGAVMMCSSASLQVNLEAGTPAQWSARVTHAHRLGPVLVAVSGCSPMLAGRPTGWSSTRHRLWSDLDRARCGPLTNTDDPAHAWSKYALQAPVMFVRAGTDRSGADLQPVLVRVPFGDWASGRVRLGGRRPVLADLDLHLTTLLPPTRLRGFLELRCLDAVPARWWPGLATTVALLMDDPRAVQAAAAACAPVAGCWDVAACEGLAHPALARAAGSCLEAAVAASPASLRPDVEALADLVLSGRSPGDLVAARAQQIGPLALLAESARVEHDYWTQEAVSAEPSVGHRPSGWSRR